MIATTTGWDINPRALGTVPKETRSPSSTASTGSPTRSTPSSPRASRADELSAILALLQFMLTPEQQAKAYDDGYFYPGPAVKGVHAATGARREPGGHQRVRPRPSTTS